MCLCAYATMCACAYAFNIHLSTEIHLSTSHQPAHSPTRKQGGDLVVIGRHLGLTPCVVCAKFIRLIARGFAMRYAPLLLLAICGLAHAQVAGQPTGLDTVVQFAPSIIFCGLLLYPLAKVIKRAGFSPWWCLIALVPIANLIALWRFAFVRWPADTSL